MTTTRKFAHTLSSIFLALLFCTGAFAATPPAFDTTAGRVRILDYENGSAAGLLFLEIDKGMDGLLKTKPAWQSHDHASIDTPEQLALDVASGAFDLVITGDEAFAKDLGDRNALLDRIPLFRSELILVGPHGDGKKFEGRKTPELMKELFASKKIFFTPMHNAWIAAQEALLWRSAGVPNPEANTNYVESGRSDLSLLLQVEEEGGYTLTTTGAFAQYMTSTRAPEPLVKLASTGVYHRHYLCLIDHQGFREERTKNAEKLAEWLAGDKARQTINDFTLAGIRPFVAE